MTASFFYCKFLPLFFAFGCLSVLAEEAPPKNKAPVDFTTCTTAKCHIEKRHKAFMHDTVKRNECNLCHKPEMGVHKFNLVNNPARICVDCHKEFSAAQLKTSDKGYQIQTKTGSFFSHPFNVKIPPEMLNSERREALDKFKMKFDQGKLTCLTCHDSHQGDNRYFLREFDAEQLQTEFCVRCHKLEHPLKHPLFSDGKSGKKVLPEQVQCSKCHHVHRGTHQHLLTLPKAEASQTPNICSSCHEEESTGNVHPLGKGVCSECHSFHKQTLKDTALLRSAKDGKSGICFDCHAEKRALERSPHDYSHWENQVQEKVAEVLERPWPITMDCELCHQMHKSPAKGSLLLKSKNRKDGAAIDRLCLSCHENEKLKSIPQVKYYGMSVPLAFNFLEDPKLDPKKNLPFFDKEGRKTTAPDAVVSLGCATCHDPHVHNKNTSDAAGGVSGKYLRKSQMIIKYCAACHGVQTLIIYPLFHTSRHRRSEPDE